MIKTIGILLLFSSCLYGEIKNSRILKMNLFLDMKEYSKAYTELKKIDINNVPVKQKALFYNKAGYINYKLNNHDQALTNYFKALKLEPKLFYVYNNIGVIYYSKKRYNEAKTYYLKAYTNNNYPKVMVNLAVINFYLKNYKKAYDWLKKSLTCNTKYVQERFNKEKALGKLEDWAEKNPDDKDIQKILKWAKKNKDKKITNIEFIEDYF